MSFTVESQGSNENNYLIDYRKPDIRVRLLRLYLLFGSIILLGSLIVLVILNNRIEQEIIASDLQLVKAITANLQVSTNSNFLDKTLEYVEIKGLEEPFIVTFIDRDNNQTSSYQVGIALDETTEWNMWQRLVFRTAAFNETGTFLSTDPAGQEWLHAHALILDGSKLILQRPTRTAFSDSKLFTWAIIVSVIIYIIGGAFSWFILTNQVITPLEQLENYSERIRWQGQLSPLEQEAINILMEKEDQLGNLARSLSAMQEETHKRLFQLATLLETSRVVAASLESAEVIDNILDQVQKLFQVTRCAVVVLDQRAGLFRIRASRGLSDTYARQLRIAPSEPTSPSMRALRNKNPIQVSDTEADLAFARHRERARAQGFRSVLAIPLETQYAPPAVLILYKSEPYRYSFSELELASSFGHHASIALENAALFSKTDDRLQEQTRRLEAIVESLNDGLILESPAGNILFCNQCAISMLNLSRSQVNQKSSSDLIELLFSKAVDPPLNKNDLLGARHKQHEFSIDLTLNGESNKKRDLRIHFFDVNDDQGVLLGKGQLWHDVTRDKELDRMKSALLSTVSHELRTPLATIKGFASTLLAKDVHWDLASQQEFLQSISNETDRLTQLVQNLLDMSRIQAGMLTIKCELYSLNDLLFEVVQAFSAEYDNRLHLTTARKLPPVWMDISRIRTVMRNLIENALKYSTPETPIELSTQKSGDEVQFSIRDYGPGIPPELREKVFDRFFRVDNGLTREVGGTGLGLAICKGFVAAHGGKIWVQPVNIGSIFMFSLPIDRESDRE